MHALLFLHHYHVWEAFGLPAFTYQPLTTMNKFIISVPSDTVEKTQIHILIPEHLSEIVTVTVHQGFYEDEEE